MTTATLTELELFHRFVGEQLARGERALTPQESLERFVAYRRDVEKLRELLRPALEEVERGECGPIDWDEFFREAEARAGAQGVPE